MRIAPWPWLVVCLLAAGLGAGVRPAVAQEADSPSVRAAVAHLQGRAGAARGTAGVAVTDASRSERSGLTYVYARPAVDGVEVADDPALVVVDAAGEIVYEGGALVAGVVESGQDVIGPAEAGARAARALGVPVGSVVAGVRRGERAGEVPLSAPGLNAASGARLVYHRTGTGRLRLAYEVTLYPTDPLLWAVVRIDAATGAELWRTSLVITEPAEQAARNGRPEARVASPAAVTSGGGGASYLVYPAPMRSPADGALPLPADGRAEVVGPADATASPFGWHDVDGRPGADFTTTRGNNAYAFADRDGNQTPDAGGVPDGGADLRFAFPLDLAGEPQTYTAAAATNAFYWVNYAHDVLYAYGFTESAGNFQENSYGRGGAGLDPVRVMVQSSNGVNNAAMTFPSDGVGPVMTLLEWTRTSPRRDAALDNEVVVHEYVHGLTTRLTGGARNTGCLGNLAEQMGEGWSDWYALMLTMTPGDARARARDFGTYAAGGAGLRPAAYSTDFAVNDYTYGHTATRSLAAPHGVGFVWATALWEVTWDLIDAHGFAADLTDGRGAAGNQIALSLVTEALRLQPCNPGFVSGRDAILAADRLLYRGEHLGLLWAAFARRGLGGAASQGSSADNGDNAEAFDVPAVSTADAVPPGAVTTLAAVSASSTSATVTFQATGDDGQTGTAAYYDIRYAFAPILTDGDFRAAARMPQQVARASGTVENVSLNGLLSGTTYSVALRVVDDAGNASDLSNVVAVVVRPGQSPPNPVTDLAVTEVRGRSVVLSFRAPAADTAASAAATYDVRYAFQPIETGSDFQSASRGPRVPAASPGSVVDITVPGLRHSTPYFFALQVQNAAGNVSGLSNLVAATTAIIETVPPGPVTDLVVVAAELQALTVAFTATGDDGQTGQAAYYDIRYSQYPIWTGGDFLRAASLIVAANTAGTAERVTIPYLLPATTYYVSLRVVDASGNMSAISPHAMATTAGGQAAPPVTVTVVLVEPRRVEVTLAPGEVRTVPLSARQTQGLGEVSVGVAVNRFVSASGDPNALGYVASLQSLTEANPGPPEVASLGTRIDGWLPIQPGSDPEDDGYVDVDLPFAFPFDGREHATVRVYTNGLLSFEAVPLLDPVNGRLGVPSAPNAVVAGLWADLVVEADGGVYVGRLPDGRFGVGFSRVSVVGRPPADRYSFDVLLSESGEIDVVYRIVPSAVPAQRGLESHSGFRTFRLPDPLRAGELHHLAPLPNVVTPRSAQFGLPLRTATSVDVVFDATGLVPGVYSTRLVFTADVPNRSLAEVTAVMTVDAAAPPPAPVLPAEVELSAARPNPARSLVTLAYGLPTDSPVRVAVYDVRGREVAVLASGDREAGRHDAVWTPGGAAGVYVVRLVAGLEVRAVSVVVVR